MDDNDVGKDLDKYLNEFELPSDAEVKLETGQRARADGLRSPSVRAKIGRSLKNSAKYRAAIKNRDLSFKQTSEYREARRQSGLENYRDPEKRAHWEASMAALRNDPERMAKYKENYNKGNTAKYDDPAFWEAYYAAIKIRDADPEQRKKIRAGTRKAIAVGCQTPLGVFECIQDAADAHEMGYNTLCHRLKSPTYPEWIRLSSNRLK